MEGACYFGDIEVRKLQKKLYEYRFPQRSRYRSPDPPSKQELISKMKVKKSSLTHLPPSKQQSKVMKQIKEQFNEEKYKIMTDVILSRAAKNAKKSNNGANNLENS